MGVRSGKRRKVSAKLKAVLFALLIFGTLASLTVFVLNSDIAVLDPKGTIAAEQRELIIIGSLLGLLVVVPVFVMTFFIVWKYREGNKKPKKYSPEWDRSKLAESLWWGIPIAIIVVLSVITWRSSHQLDPFKALESDKKPLTIQVVALEWKWLFIYPEQDIATVNFIQFPEDTPINFEITSDAPMNSFWIPELGGQIYAMAGMTTKLHLIADNPGEFNGSSANLSGGGFSGMRFVAKASTAQDFETWVASVKESSDRLSLDEYERLAEPSKDNPATYYSSRDKTLYDTVIMKYMSPDSGHDQQKAGHDE